MTGRVVNPPTWRKTRGWRRLIPKSLLGQMVLVLALALLATQLLSVIIFADERRVALQALNQDETIARTASTLRVLAETPEELHDRILDAASSNRLRFWVSGTGAVSTDHARVIENRLARWLRRQIDVPRERKVRVEIREVEYGWFRTELEPEDDWEDYERNGKRWGDHGPTSLLISVQLEDGRWLNAENLFRFPSRGRKWAAVSVISILVIGVGLGSILLVRRITRPMRRLADAAERMGRGETIETLEEQGPLEARETTQAFNVMHERLRRYIDDRNHMMAATGHDLRTPLTSLRLRAELVDDDELKLKMLANIDEMTRMVEAMLAFAREDAKAEETRETDLSALVQSIADDLTEIGLTASVVSSERVVSRCRPVSLTRAIRNLMENAARYGGEAKGSVAQDDDGILIVVEDNGPGIPETDLERVFEPFTRLDGARQTAGGSMGLGLAIARSVVRAHGGDIVLTNRGDGAAVMGLRAEVRLPLA